MANDPYARLIAHMQEWFIGLPETEEMRRLLEARLSPPEAVFLARLPFMPRTVEELAEAFGETAGALGARLDPLARRGLVFRHESRGTVRYALNESMFMFFRSPFWAGTDDAKTRELARLSNRYFYPAYGQEFGRIPSTGLRAIPIRKTVQDPRRIQPFEDVVQVLEREELVCVAHCPCRQRRNLDAEATPCRHETRNCLHFGRLARYMIQQGMGVEIGRREAAEVLEASADAGLVHGISGHRGQPDSICNCCSCCCIYLQSANVLGLFGHQASNYRAHVDEAACVGCGQCEERCPMGAVRLEVRAGARNKAGKISAVDSGRCIGCGVCAHKCPSAAIRLRHGGPEADIPETERALAQRMARERNRRAPGLMKSPPG
jgi:ferredoxin/DNA-binding transcriptional ArsR family regulator